jgi:hypothetical protein
MTWRLGGELLFSMIIEPIIGFAKEQPTQLR